MIKKLRTTLIGLGAMSAVAFAGPAAAQDVGFYAGLAIGQTEANGFCDSFIGALSCDEKDSGWKIFGGHQFNRNFALELGYANLGEATLTGSLGSATVEATAFDLSAIGLLPLIDRLAVFARLGLYRADIEARNTLGGSGDDSETGLTFGLGLRWDFTRNLGAKVEWQRYQEVVDDIDGDFLSVGIIWRF